MCSDIDPSILHTMANGTSYKSSWSPLKGCDRSAFMPRLGTMPVRNDYVRMPSASAIMATTSNKLFTETLSMDHPMRGIVPSHYCIEAQSILAPRPIITFVDGE
jgi:hypothetical protein